MTPTKKAQELAISATKYVDDKGEEVYNTFCEAACIEMHKWTKEDMLKNLEVWKDYYLYHNSFKVADALDEIITWFRSPEDTEE